MAEIFLDKAKISQRIYYLIFPLPLGSGYYRTFKKKIGGPFAVAVRRNFFPY